LRDQSVDRGIILRWSLEMGCGGVVWIMSLRIWTSMAVVNMIGLVNLRVPKKDG
jgi:hypothetical protein